MTIALMNHDPQPTVVLSAEALTLAVNPAMSHVLGEAPMSGASAWLPTNVKALVRACLQQARAIDRKSVV